MHGSNKNWTMKPLSRHKCVHRSQFPYLQGVDLCQHEVVGKQSGLDAVAERQPVIAVQGNRDGSQSSRILPTFTNPTPYSLSLARLMNSVPSPSANPLPIDIAVAQRGQRVTASHPRAPSVSPKLFTPQHRQRRRYQPTATMHNRHVLPDGDDDDGSLHRRRRKDVCSRRPRLPMGARSLSPPHADTDAKNTSLTGMDALPAVDALTWLVMASLSAADTDGRSSAVRVMPTPARHSEPATSVVACVGDGVGSGTGAEQGGAWETHTRSWVRTRRISSCGERTHV